MGSVSENQCAEEKKKKHFHLDFSSQRDLEPQLQIWDISQRIYSDNWAEILWHVRRAAEVKLHVHEISDELYYITENGWQATRQGDKAAKSHILFPLCLIGSGGIEKKN